MLFSYFSDQTDGFFEHVFVMVLKPQAKSRRDERKSPPRFVQQEVFPHGSWVDEDPNGTTILAASSYSAPGIHLVYLVSGEIHIVDIHFFFQDG